MLIMMFMLMMLMLMKVEQVPTFCTAKAMDGSFAECSVEDKPVYCMPNVTKTVSRTSLSTECLSAEPFNLNSVSFSQAIYTSDVSSARQNSVPM